MPDPQTTYLKPTPRKQPAEFAAPSPAGAGMPLPVGRVIRPHSMTDAEKAQLKAIGWKEGDPIPADMATRIEAMQQAAGQLAAETAQAPIQVPKGAPQQPMKVPDEISIAELPAEHQAALQSALSQAKAELEAAANRPQGLGFGASEVIEVVDDTQQTPAGESSTAQTGSNAPIISQSHCPHCAWDLSVRDIEDPSEEERTWFLQAILGEIQFEKPHGILGDQVVFVFREMTLYDKDRLYQQVGEKSREAATFTQGDFVETVERFTLATQLVKVHIGGHVTVIPLEPDPDLADRMDQLSQTVFKNTAIYRMAIFELKRFNRMIAKLEACAERENFWKAV